MILSLVGLVVAIAACQPQLASTPTMQDLRSASPTLAPPSATPRQAATFTPTPGGLVRLSLDFSEDLPCVTAFEEEYGSGKAVEGVYRIELIEGNSLALAPCETIVVGDLVLDVEVEVRETPLEDYYYGVMFRITGNERYAFVLGAYDNYCLFYAIGSQFVPLTNSTDFDSDCWVRLPEEAVDGGKQRLRVAATGDRIDFYLNEVLLGVVRDHQLTGGWVGFTAATGTEGGLVVEFDNLQVVKP